MKGKWQFIAIKTIMIVYDKYPINVGRFLVVYSIKCNSGVSGCTTKTSALLLVINLKKKLQR